MQGRSNVWRIISDFVRGNDNSGIKTRPIVRPGINARHPLSSILSRRGQKSLPLSHLCFAGVLLVIAISFHSSFYNPRKGHHRDFVLSVCNSCVNHILVLLDNSGLATLQASGARPKKASRYFGLQRACLGHPPHHPIPAFQTLPTSRQILSLDYDWRPLGMDLRISLPPMYGSSILATQHSVLLDVRCPGNIPLAHIHSKNAAITKCHE